MDLLEYGMEKEQSDSALERLLARGALAAARKKADMYESYLENKQISFPEGTQEDASLLAKIRDGISSAGPKASDT